MMRRGQTEMIGLVFIVVLIVVGIVIYLRMSVDDVENVEQEQQGSVSFLVALKETTLPACGVSFERAAAACFQGETLCTSRDPCLEIQNTMDELSLVLLRQGFKYNLSIEGTALETVSSCQSGDRSVDLLMAPRVPLVYASGGAQRFLRLSVCR